MNKNEASVMDARLVEILGADVMGIADSGLENATIKMSHINRLWKEGIYGDCKIGVVDTGLSQIDHPMIKDKVITGRNFTNDNRGIDNLYSSHFHGLAVCSLIAGNYMNKICFGGSPNCKIVLAKVMEDNGSGDLSNIAQGINYCVSEGCSIINLSVGSTYDSDELKQAVKNAVDKNISIVCASGNDNNPELDRNGYSIDEKRYPGYYSESIVVGSITKDFEYSYFSNTNNMVDVVAQGSDVVVAYKDNLYATVSGTSFSTPILSSILALLRQKFTIEFGRVPCESELYGYLLKYTRKIDGMHTKIQGHGYVDLSINRTKKLK